MRQFVVLALAVGALSNVGAQAVPDHPHGAGVASDQVQAEPPREGRARFLDPDDGQLDLSYFLENPRGFLPVPIVVTEPAVGYGGGFAGMFLRPREEAGEEGWARPNISAVGVLAT